MDLRLNLGAGNKRLPGFLNIDRVSLPAVDLAYDLERLPLPFADNSVSEVVCEHVLEHVHNFIGLMEELYRVCRPEAVIKVSVPYYKYEQAYGDPTHVRFFTERTFEFFSSEHVYGYYSKARFRVRKGELRNTSKTGIKTPLKRLRRFIPFKKVLSLFLWNLYSEIYFELEPVK